MFFSCILPAFCFLHFSLKYYNAMYAKLCNINLLIQSQNLLQNVSADSFLKLIQNNKLFYDVLFFFLSFLFLQCLHLFSSYLSSKSLPLVHKKLKKKAFEEVLSYPMNFFQNYNPANIEKNVLNFADASCQLIESSYYFVEKISSILIILVKFLQFKPLFFVANFWILSLVFVSYFLLKKILIYTTEKESIQNIQSGFITESFENMLIFKLNNCKHFLYNKFEKNQSIESNFYKKINLIFGHIRFIFGMVNISFFLLIYLIIIKLKLNFLGLNVGLFFTWSWSLVMNCWQLMWQVLPLFFLLGKINKSIKFLSYNKTVEKKSHYLDSFKELAVHEISFSYKETPILNKFSMICKNEFVNISGKSGVGKSSLFNIIMSLNHPSNGHITINGVNLDLIDNLYEKTSYLPQNDLIYNDTIESNIVLDKKYDPQKLENILKMLKFDDFIPLNKIDSIICGPNGSKISGGQMKRIAIARMLLFDSEDNLMLLDEPFNSLSQDIIENLLNYLNALKGTRTILCIDHSGYFAKIADKNYTL